MATIVSFTAAATVEQLQSGVIGFSGQVDFRDENVEIEYHELLQGLKTGEVRHNQFTPEQLGGFDFKRKLLGGAIMTLRAGRIGSFDECTLARDGRIVLKIGRPHREDAVKFMAALQTRLDFPA